MEAASGVTTRFIGSLERGSANPSLMTLIVLAEALDVPAWQLVRAAEDAAAG